MTRFQKIAFILFITLSAVFAYLGYKALRNKKPPSVNALSLVPDSCSLMMSFGNYAEFSNSLKNKNLLWQDLSEIKSLRGFDKTLAIFDSLLILNTELENVLDNNTVYFALYPSSQYIILFNLKERADEKKLKETIDHVLPASGLKAVMQDGIICVSNTEQLISKVFDSKNSKLLLNKNFKMLNDATNYKGTALFVNQSAGIIPSNSFSGITIKPESIALNGMSIPDTLSFFGDANAKPINNLDFLKNIPLVCSAFETYAISAPDMIFKKALTKDDWWQTVNENALFNAKTQFYNCISDNITTVQLPSKNKALIVSVKDSVRIRELLPFISDSSYLHNTIFKLISSSGFIKSTFPSLKINETAYAVAFNDRIIFTANENDAEIFVNAELNNSSVLDDNSFSQYVSKNFDSEFHYLEYKLINSLSQEFLPFGNFLNKEDTRHLKNLSHCSILGVFKNNFLNYRVNLKYFQENVSDEPNVLWTINSDTTIHTKPFIFINHATKGKELVYQTVDNTLYLQNATGKVIWQKKINEPVRSDIMMVDAFKNEKYQLLFNTDNYIHLIDRNGNYVQGYPVKLPSKATNKLTVFDYENKNDLRLFIACADRKIYNYSIWGIRQEGFKPHATAAEVVLPIRYCKVGLSDYLITADKKGKLYAFSRKGEGRIDFKNKMIEDAENFELESGNSISNTYIIYYDPKNSLIDKISLTDKKEIYKTTEADIKPSYIFGDFDKNSLTDVVLAYSNAIEVYDANGIRNLEKKLPETMIPAQTGFHLLNSNVFISILDETNANIALYGSEQKTIKYYKGNKSPLLNDLFNDGKPYVVIVNGNKLKCSKL